MADQQRPRLAGPMTSCSACGCSRKLCQRQSCPAASPENSINAVEEDLDRGLSAASSGWTKSHKPNCHRQVARWLTTASQGQFLAEGDLQQCKAAFWCRRQSLTSGSGASSMSGQGPANGQNAALAVFIEPLPPEIPKTLCHWLSDGSRNLNPMEQPTSPKAPFGPSLQSSTDFAQ